MQIVTIHEAKKRFSRIVEQAEVGEEIVITRAGKPVARLVSLDIPAPVPRKLGLGKNRFTFPAGFENMQVDEINSMFGLEK